MRFACEVKGFEVEKYLERKEARKADPARIKRLPQLMKRWNRPACSQTE